MEKKNFKPTLNLPKTDFAMKANLAQNEPATIKRWEENNQFEKIQDYTKHNPPFTFHDGPPYANGDIHVGHLLNKVLKDIVVRSQLTLNKSCHFVPGWDCHGLPIEHKVMTEIIAKKADKFEALPQDTQRMIIRSECTEYAKKYIKLQSGQMQRLLTLADYKHPYLTMDPKYEEKVLDVFASLVEEGIVYRQLKPVHWSLANQTALADAELEYKDKEDLSVYVTFKAADQATSKALFNTSSDKPLSFMIWTTTPWTLPANLAIAIHPKFTYVCIETASQLLVVAKELAEKVMGLKQESFSEIGELSGSELLGQTYLHPFLDKTRNVVGADYVTLEDGTGLVHTAPGHGADDYQTGLREGLEVYCPVLGNGVYDDTVPDWLKGLHIWKANPLIAERLAETGHLFYSQKFLHSYPHDWRSKTPVIFRSTEQWFVAVDTPLTHGKTLRSMALDSIENNINFIPDWGQNRLRGMMEARPDWCLSRQRSWGLPIPSFRDKHNTVLLTEKSVRAVAKLIGEQGSDCWFKSSPKELLTYYDISQDPKAPQTVDWDSLEKMYDIFDVWFESGSSWNAVLNARGFDYPADLYLEGSDQHRGWFHLSLLPALGVTKKAPYKNVLTHGFIVDKDGKKMSKSTGNALSVEDIVKKYGAEVTRWWVGSLAFENDIKVDESYFQVAGDGYRKVRNTVRFLLSNIFDLNTQTLSTAEILSQLNAIPSTSIDGYALAKTWELHNEVNQAYTEFKFKKAHTLLYQFCNDTLSAFYCSVVKDRLYCDATTSKRRTQSQLTSWYITHVLCRLLAPFLPHTAEEALHELTHSNDASPFLSESIAFEYALDPKWDTLLTLRTQVQKELELSKEKGIENTLDAGIILSSSLQDIAAFQSDLADIFGVSRVTIADQDQPIHVQDLKQEPRCERSWKRDETVALRDDGSWLSDRDYEAVCVAERTSHVS